MYTILEVCYCYVVSPKIYSHMCYKMQLDVYINQILKLLNHGNITHDNNKSKISSFN
jgi:hypothetical protein